MPDGVLATSAERLRLLGFDLGPLGVTGTEPLVRLSDLPGVTYRIAKHPVGRVDAVDTAVRAGGARTHAPPTPLDVDRRPSTTPAQSSSTSTACSATPYQGGAKLPLTRRTWLRLAEPAGPRRPRPSCAASPCQRRSAGRPEHVRLDTYWRRRCPPRDRPTYSVGDASVSEGGGATPPPPLAYRPAGCRCSRTSAAGPTSSPPALPMFQGTAAVPSDRRSLHQWHALLHRRHRPRTVRVFARCPRTSAAAVRSPR